MRIFKWMVNILPLIYMGLIWYVSSKPSDAVFTLGTYDNLIKEALHLVEFTALYIMILAALWIDGLLNRKLNITVVILTIIYSATDEIHQMFVPGRSAMMIDFMKDIILVLAIGIFLNRRVLSVDRKRKYL